MFWWHLFMLTIVMIYDYVFGPRVSSSTHTKGPARMDPPST